MSHLLAGLLEELLIWTLYTTLRTLQFRPYRNFGGHDDEVCNPRGGVLYEDLALSDGDDAGAVIDFPEVKEFAITG